MKSLAAKNLLRENIQLASMRGAGLNVRSMGLMASRAAQIMIADVQQLPVQRSLQGELQNDDGDFYFFLGYSVMGGGHVMR